MPRSEPFRSAGEQPVEVKNLRLDLDVNLPKKTATGTATLDVSPVRKLERLELDAVEFEVREVSLKSGDGEKSAPVAFSHDGKKLHLSFDPPLAAGSRWQVAVRYTVRDPQAGLHFFGPTEAEPDVPLTVWSQGEPDSNRHWIPCLDRPAVRQSTELVVTVPAGYDVLSNGKLLVRKPSEDKKTETFHWRQENPHPSYLVTLVVGKFDVVEEKWDGLPVLYYVPQGKKPDVARTFGRTREMLEFFSRRFGVHYPWEKYAQVVVEQFTAGGMENTSATTLTDRALHDERAMLDSTPDSLIAHELAHQWWGDLVTCRDWAHLWLNEGFASYSEALWDEHKLGADQYAYTMLVKSRQAIAGGKERPVVDRRYPAARAMFDARVYPKGAFVLHMLRDRVGEEAFWKGIQKYATEYKFQSVETADFRRTMEKVSGRDLEPFFHDWLDRPGHPAVEVEADYSADRGGVTLQVKQTQAGEAFRFPLTVRVHHGGKAEDFEFEVGGKDQTFGVPVKGRPTLVEIDPGQRVLMELKETKPRDWWGAQLTQSKSVVSRARAAEYFGTAKTVQDREVLSKSLGREKFWAVQTEVAKALGTSGGNASRDALLRGLGDEHPKVRRACAEQLGKFPGDTEVARALKELLKKGDASYFVEAAALGSYAKLKQPDTTAVLLPWLAKDSHQEILRNAALAGLGEGGDAGALDTLLGWTKRGKQRSNRTAALMALAKLSQTAALTPEQRAQVVKAMEACLEGENWPMRRIAVVALREVGTSAAGTLPLLERLAKNDPDFRVQEVARQAAESLRPRPTGGDDVAKLREEVEKLKKTQADLIQRLERYEKMERKGDQ